MPAQLLALTDGPSILLDKPILLLGRHPECDIQLNSRKVSRRHCCIAQVREYLVVRDLGSTNGIRINGNRVLEGRLKAGDELTIGNFKYQICWDLPGEPMATPTNRKKPAAAPPFSKSVEQLLEEADFPVPLEEEDGAGRGHHARTERAKTDRAKSSGQVSKNGSLDDEEEEEEEGTFIPPKEQIPPSE